MVSVISECTRLTLVLKQPGTGTCHLLTNTVTTSRVCGFIMGNCTSGIRKKTKGNSAADDKGRADKPTEDVTYASIDHSTAKGFRANTVQPDNDCDYAIVNVPAALQMEHESDCSSKDECADDYVLMG
ncbi:hypothetical protein INR49_021934 [Caranx melampygus]|nr:hypothetical protein INR49_021934 [Caranx melampygus]